MKKRLSIVLCLALIICLVPMSSALAKKNVKSKSVSVAPKSMTLAVGDIAQLNATMKPSNSTDKLTWSSSDKSVATVTSKGVVKGVSEGNATITVKTSSKKTATCSVAVKKYVTADEITDSVAEGLKEKFATKDSVLELIKQNTYTKSEIDTKIASTSSGGSSNCSDDFTDGDELQLYSGQSLPYTLNTSSGKSITITSASIKKYHYNQKRGNSFSPYKYILEINGSISGVTGTDLVELDIEYMSKDGCSSEGRYYLLRSGTDGNTDTTYSQNENQFKVVVDQYLISSNYDLFYFDYMYIDSNDE